MSDELDTTDRPQPGQTVSGDEALGLLRVAASTWWHTTEWGVQQSLRATRRLVEAAVSPQAAAHLAEDIGKVAREAARELIGISDVEERVRGSELAQRVAEAVPTQLPSGLSLGASVSGSRRREEANGDSLRDRGQHLMRLSRDVRHEEEAHPAYERILEELAPDEARILTLLLRSGPQPSVDVRTGGPLGLLSSDLIAPGLNMIGGRAGLRYVDRVPAYLNNLYRLGMIWFSRETLKDPLEYQVVEAQPDVLEAFHSVRFAKIVRRSIHLTPFGEDFCRSCLLTPDGASDVLPPHSSPEEPRREAQPGTSAKDAQPPVSR
jgi:hypothetical protein